MGHYDKRERSKKKKLHERSEKMKAIERKG